MIYIKMSEASGGSEAINAFRVAARWKLNFEELFSLSLAEVKMTQLIKQKLSWKNLSW